MKYEEMSDFEINKAVAEAATPLLINEQQPDKSAVFVNDVVSMQAVRMTMNIARMQNGTNYSRPKGRRCLELVK